MHWLTPNIRAKVLVSYYPQTMALKPGLIEITHWLTPNIRAKVLVSYYPQTPALKPGFA
jgi:hypothetical protein